VDLVGVSTLRALALAAHGSAHPQGLGILALIDARRGELFGAGWPYGADPRTDTPVLEPSVLEPAELDAVAATLAHEPGPADRRAPGLLAVGDGAVKFRSVLERSAVIVPDDLAALHRVSALGHCVLAADMQPGDTASVLPEYLRLADAEIARRKAIHT
jgi:tRNA A37 threonylcarbamoyladenosine modification protein TsaB